MLSDTLPLFMVPVLQIVHEFPRLVNGKIDRQALIAGYEKSEVLTLAYTNDELEPLENEADRTRARVILTSIGIFFGFIFYSIPQCCVKKIESKKRHSCYLQDKWLVSLTQMTNLSSLTAFSLLVEVPLMP